MATISSQPLGQGVHRWLPCQKQSDGDGAGSSCGLRAEARDALTDRRQTLAFDRWSGSPGRDRPCSQV